MRIDRLKLIAEGLLTLKEFDFSTIIRGETTPTGRFKKPTLNCGAVGCAVGSIPIIDPEGGVRWVLHFGRGTVGTDDSVGYAEVASEYFQISRSDAGNLFTSYLQYDLSGWGDHPVCDDGATAQEVHDAMMHYIEIRS